MSNIILYVLFQSCGKIATEVDAENVFSHTYDPGNSQHRVYVFDAEYGKHFKENEKIYPAP